MNKLCELAKHFGPLVGRILLCMLFVLSGYQKLTHFSGSADYMASKMAGLDPMAIKILLVITIIIELGGGLMVLIGWQARWAATAILGFLVPVTLIFHPFWNVPEAERQLQYIMFMKNMAIMGGFALILAYGPGRYSLGKDKC